MRFVLIAHDMDEESVECMCILDVNRMKLLLKIPKTSPRKNSNHKLRYCSYLLYCIVWNSIRDTDKIILNYVTKMFERQDERQKLHFFPKTPPFAKFVWNTNCCIGCQLQKSTLSKF